MLYSNQDLTAEPYRPIQQGQNCGQRDPFSWPTQYQYIHLVGGYPTRPLLTHALHLVAKRVSKLSCLPQQEVELGHGQATPFMAKSISPPAPPVGKLVDLKTLLASTEFVKRSIAISAPRSRRHNNAVYSIWAAPRETDLQMSPGLLQLFQICT